MFFQTCAKLAFCLTQIYFLAITAWYRVYRMCFLISRNAILGFRKNTFNKTRVALIMSKIYMLVDEGFISIEVFFVNFIMYFVI